MTMKLLRRLVLASLILALVATGLPVRDALARRSRRAVAAAHRRGNHRYCRHTRAWWRRHRARKRARQEQAMLLRRRRRQAALEAARERAFLTTPTFQTAAAAPVAPVAKSLNAPAAIVASTLDLTPAAPAFAPALDAAHAAPVSASLAPRVNRNLAPSLPDVKIDGPAASSFPAATLRIATPAKNSALPSVPTDDASAAPAPRVEPKPAAPAGIAHVPAPSHVTPAAAHVTPPPAIKHDAPTPSPLNIVGPAAPLRSAAPLRVEKTVAPAARVAERAARIAAVEAPPVIEPSFRKTRASKTDVSGVRNPFDFAMPQTWRLSGASARGEMKFAVTGHDGRDAGTATLAPVSLAGASAALDVITPRTRLLGGVALPVLRRTIIDRMIVEGGWVTNDTEREVEGRRVYVVTAQKGQGGVARESWTFYFTEVEGRLYSLATNAPVEHSAPLAAGSEQFLATLRAGNKSGIVAAKPQR